jgi:hypothetical protein
MGMIGGAGVGVASGVEVGKAVGEFVGVTVGIAAWVSATPVCPMATAVLCTFAVLVCAQAASVKTRNAMIILAFMSLLCFFSFWGDFIFPHNVERNLSSLIIVITALCSSNECHGVCRISFRRFL